MKRRFKLCALCCVLLLSLAGCGKEEVNFLYYTETAIKTLDPQLASTSAELSAVKHLFSGLYRVDAEGQAIPDAATDTKISSDGLTYTFTLDSTDVFTDGKDRSFAVTAQDYVFGLQRTVSPTTGSPYARNFLAIRGAREILNGQADPKTLGVRAISTTQLEIRLIEPDDGFLLKLASNGAMPCNKDFFEDAAGTYGLTLKSIIGNGPFYLSGWGDTNGLTLRRSGEAESGEVTRLRIIPENGDKTGFERLMDGMQDAAVITSPNEIDQLAKKGFVQQNFENGTCALFFNCADRYLSSASIRRALSASASASAALVQQTALVDATGLIPGSITLEGEGFREAAGNALPDIAAAQRYATYQLGLAEVNANKLSGVTVLVPEGSNYEELFRAVNQGWQKELGAFFSIETLSLEEIEKRMATGKYDIALYPYTVTENDPAALLQQFMTGNAANVTGFTDAEFDALLSQAFLATGNTQSRAYIAAEKELLWQAPVAPLKFQTSSFFTSAKLSGLVADPFGPVLDVSSAIFKS